VEAFQPVATPSDFYLYCGQLVPYKRADIAVEAFNRLGKKLTIIGDGAELPRLRRMAGPNITFMDRQPATVLRSIYASCRALIFPGEEDFGIVPVEAMAAGRPVIAYGKGGVCDSVRDGVGGILYPEKTVDGLMNAVSRFEREEASFSQSDIVAEAARFSGDRFRNEFCKLIESKLADFYADGPPRMRGL
jgi:glycosyltransferase involved in cell wall biosynthesis